MRKKGTRKLDLRIVVMYQSSRCNVSYHFILIKHIDVDLKSNTISLQNVLSSSFDDLLHLTQCPPSVRLLNLLRLKSKSSSAAVARDWRVVVLGRGV